MIWVIVQARHKNDATMRYNRSIQSTTKDIELPVFTGVTLLGIPSPIGVDRSITLVNDLVSRNGHYEHL